ncbi:MAG: arginine--tRNA ligase, partial [Gammaproteobacteria bacterium]|nr:arginine--tRNA ligase [Gammaproteobacteria bacterium]
MRASIEKIVGKALQRMVEDSVIEASAIPRRVGVERTRDPAHGDFATNVAMTMAKAARCNPRELAQKIVTAIPDDDTIAAIEIAGPGFINFRLSDAARYATVGTVIEDGAAYGHSKDGAGTSVLVEFVSANPTGPLHVGHGRHAAYGDSVARLLEATGHDVHREYYVNDAGRQIDILTASLWLRYLELAGQQISLPQAAYQGDYVIDIARQLHNEQGDKLVHPVAAVFAGLPADGERPACDEHIDALIARCRELLGEQQYRLVATTALESVLADIREDLAEFGIEYDRFFSERQLVEDKLI